MMKRKNNIFAAKLKAFRHETEMPQYQIAHLLGCSVSAIQKYESGERTPSEEQQNDYLCCMNTTSAKQSELNSLNKLLDYVVIDAANGSLNEYMRFIRKLKETFFIDDYMEMLSSYIVHYQSVIAELKGIDGKKLCQYINKIYCSKEIESIIDYDEEAQECFLSSVTSVVEIYKILYPKTYVEFKENENISLEKLYEHKLLEMLAFSKIINDIPASYIPNYNKDSRISVCLFNYYVFVYIRITLQTALENSISNLDNLRDEIQFTKNIFADTFNLEEIELMEKGIV